MHLLRSSDMALLCGLGLIAGEAVTDLSPLIATGMIAFPSPQSHRGQVVVLNYQKWVLLSCLNGRTRLHWTVVSRILSSKEVIDCSAWGLPFMAHGWTC